MLTIDGKKISLSKGDTFDVTFAVNGYRLKDGDSVIFSHFTYKEKCCII